MRVIGKLLRFVVGLAIIYFGIRYVAIQFGLFHVLFHGINTCASGLTSKPVDDWRVIWGLGLWSLGSLILVAGIVVSIRLDQVFTYREDFFDRKKGFPNPILALMPVDLDP